MNTFPRPAPIIALVGVNISAMPGPPFGPSPLIITTLPWNKQIDIVVHEAHNLLADLIPNRAITNISSIQTLKRDGHYRHVTDNFQSLE